MPKIAGSYPVSGRVARGYGFNETGSSTIGPANLSAILTIWGTGFDMRLVMLCC